MVSGQWSVVKNLRQMTRDVRPKSVAKLRQNGLPAKEKMKLPGAIKSEKVYVITPSLRPLLQAVAITAECNLLRVLPKENTEMKWVHIHLH